MHQTKKGNQWYFGMKAHIGVDIASGLVHSVYADMVAQCVEKMKAGVRAKVEHPFRVLSRT
jgi:IS5 family transposase